MTSRHLHDLPLEHLPRPTRVVEEGGLLRGHRVALDCRHAAGAQGLAWRAHVLACASTTCNGCGRVVDVSGAPHTGWCGGGCLEAGNHLNPGNELCPDASSGGDGNR